LLFSLYLVLEIPLTATTNAFKDPPSITIVLLAKSFYETMKAFKEMVKNVYYRAIHLHLTYTYRINVKMVNFLFCFFLKKKKYNKMLTMVKRTLNANYG
jgi:hypothetical protein